MQQCPVGVSFAGRRTYDTSIADWGADGPGSGRRTPTIIVSHSIPDTVPESGVYTFEAFHDVEPVTMRIHIAPQELTGKPLGSVI